MAVDGSAWQDPYCYDLRQRRDITPSVGPPKPATIANVSRAWGAQVWTLTLDKRTHPRPGIPCCSHLMLYKSLQGPVLRADGVEVAGCTRLKG